MSHTSDDIQRERNILIKQIAQQKKDLRQLEEENTSHIREKQGEIDKTESVEMLLREQYMQVTEMERRQREDEDLDIRHGEFQNIPDLLYTLQELHAPDRCEGVGNDIWHDMQRFANTVTWSSTRTPQQILTDWWNGITIETHRACLKLLTFEFESK